MRIFRTTKGYFYKEYKNGKKKRISKEEYLKHKKKFSKKVIYKKYIQNGGDETTSQILDRIPILKEKYGDLLKNRISGEKWNEKRKNRNNAQHICVTCKGDSKLKKSKSNFKLWSCRYCGNKYHWNCGGNWGKFKLTATKGAYTHNTGQKYETSVCGRCYDFLTYVEMFNENFWNHTHTSFICKGCGLTIQGGSHFSFSKGTPQLYEGLVLDDLVKLHKAFITSDKMKSIKTNNDNQAEQFLSQMGYCPSHFSDIALGMANNSLGAKAGHTIKKASDERKRKINNSQAQSILQLRTLLAQFMSNCKEPVILPFRMQLTNNKQLYCYKITCANKSIHWSCNGIIYNNIDDFIRAVQEG
jgi:hypothetical protein